MLNLQASKCAESQGLNFHQDVKMELVPATEVMSHTMGKAVSDAPPRPYL